MPKEDVMKKPPVFVRWVIVVFLQLIAMQVVTFAGSFFFPNSLEPGIDHPWPFAIMLGIAFTLGIFLVCWFALNRGRLDGSPSLILRLVGRLIGKYLDLVAGVVLMHNLPEGSPFFGISMLAGQFSFHLPNWVNK
jgi:hypothetical protein